MPEQSSPPRDPAGALRSAFSPPLCVRMLYGHRTASMTVGRLSAFAAPGTRLGVIWRSLRSCDKSRTNRSRIRRCFERRAPNGPPAGAAGIPLTIFGARARRRLRVARGQLMAAPVVARGSAGFVMMGRF